MNCPKVAVIIPFFQRERGILSKAIESVLKQKNIHNFEIIIIDDGSPVSAHDELAGLINANKSFIRAIKQENRGPAAARNRGLDTVSKDTAYVAFLDSDDQWSDAHLENAVFALEKGYDFYFADYARNYGNYRENSFTSWFHPLDYLIISKERNLYEFSGDLFNKLLGGTFIKTSTVVYRYGKNKNLRFPEEFIVGEDLVFFLGYLFLSKKAVFSSEVECLAGKGINIYGEPEWGSGKQLNLICDMMRVYKSIGKSFTLDFKQRQRLRKKIKYLRYEFAESLLHGIKCASKIRANTIFKQFKADPFTFIELLPNILKIAKTKL